MSDETMTITYVFTFSGNREEIFDVRLNPQTIEAMDPLPDSLPDWTRLEFHKCVHCPLNSETHPHCPLAARISGIVGRFTEIISYHRIRAAVAKDAAINAVVELDFFAKNFTLGVAERLDEMRHLFQPFIDRFR